MRPAIGFKAVIGEADDRSWTNASKVPLSRKFRWDGQPARPPKKGERYLSGAIVVAYIAKADMTTPYFIAVPAIEE